LTPGQKKKRGIERPKLRWEDNVDRDIRLLGERKWKSLVCNREEWMKLLTKEGQGQRRAVESMMMTIICIFL
jgi:hypothetical protein